MHPVSHFDLDVPEPRRDQARLELISSERTGDTPGPFLHVGASLCAHAGVSDDVGHRELSAWAKYPRGLTQDLRLVD